MGDNHRIPPAKLQELMEEEFLEFFNGATKKVCFFHINLINLYLIRTELKKIKAIGKNATYILELREDTPNPFQTMNDVKELGFSTQQMNSMITQILRFRNFWNF
ncbi:kinesin-like protein KIN-10C isoform X1 [Zingiber officinale]|uniref:kinesin-like protein KIN-10C isoform X1 n=1 Tax=Zingiber officinale TaxID=94328 RepID=UPI001C4B6DC9|nr:kinesin-like protein KIN-10C isoform X1 [Zingiber officinale]